MKEILAVAIGGSMGAVCRYLVGAWALARFGGGFPYGTLLVNVAGCFIIGFFMTFVHGICGKMPESILLSNYTRLLVTTGFLGALTTFSTYSYETFALVEKGNFFLAFCNVAVNLIIGFFATWLGICLARFIIE